MTVSFAQLGLPKPLVEQACCTRHHRGLPRAGSHHPRRTRRQGRLRQGPDRVRQDARLRPSHAHQDRQGHPQPAPRPDPRPHPGTRRTDQRRTGAARQVDGPLRLRHLRRSRIRPPDQRPPQGRRHPGGHPRPPRRPHRAGHPSTCGTPTSSSWTRPTGWPTWDSCPRSAASSTGPPRRRQTLLFSATLDGDIAVLSRDYQTQPGAPRGRDRGTRDHRCHPPLLAGRARRARPARRRRHRGLAAAPSSSPAPVTAPTASHANSPRWRSARSPCTAAAPRTSGSGPSRPSPSATPRH